jgi:transcriptional regulator with GAF, ATPase, and Fis domain
MVKAFVTKLQKTMGKEIETISKKTMESLKSYSWPGNVRELKNVIEHAMILSKDNTLVVLLPDSGLSERDATQDLHDMERLHVVSVLEKTGWRVSGKGGAAEALGLKRTTLQAKMKKLGIKRPHK